VIENSQLINVRGAIATIPITGKHAIIKLLFWKVDLLFT
jgi:hypothetical protein